MLYKGQILMCINASFDEVKPLNLYQLYTVDRISICKCGSVMIKLKEKVDPDIIETYCKVCGDTEKGNWFERVRFVELPIVARTMPSSTEVERPAPQRLHIHMPN
jgi:hypothetical protein